MAELGDFQGMVKEAEAVNPWFTEREIRRSLHAICEGYLNESALNQWLGKYAISDERSHSIVGIVAAGNIPIVSFHDVLCALACNASVRIKLSHKDQPACRYVYRFIEREGLACDFDFSETGELTVADRFIVTGSDIALRDFKSRWPSTPVLARGHRNSVAVLFGNESETELLALGKDVFAYYGLGCRNVSKLFLPLGYKPDNLLQGWNESFSWVLEHPLYVRHLKYTQAFHTVMRTKGIFNGPVALVPSLATSSPIATLHVEFYSDLKKLNDRLVEDARRVQCICSGRDIPGFHTVRFGNSQLPGLLDYADGIDTMKFILET
ncbi:MAG: hypothetical protein IT266_09105 [Saprospiraceae bacterium]|nr:hypothetical protein [Saprospiraceae bacterium]